MNILTFDTEEWYNEEAHYGGRKFKYDLFDDTLSRTLDLLDEVNLKATFFCLGKLATDFPYVIKSIAEHGHDIGCHSNKHLWLTKMDDKSLRIDTLEALKALEDLSGKKVVSYRAPAFSITSSNPWAIEVLAECGIENDASIFPMARDFGGFPSFPQDTPCRIGYHGAILNEYPICLTKICGKKMVYSGGGYFRMLPYSFVNRTIKGREYNICYFHMNDLTREKQTLMTKNEYEEYFQESGTLRNRLVRYVKSNLGKGDVLGKLKKLLKENMFINILEAQKAVDWKSTKVFEL